MLEKYSVLKCILKTVKIQLNTLLAIVIGQVAVMSNISVILSHIAIKRLYAYKNHTTFPHKRCFQGVKH